MSTSGQGRFYVYTDQETGTSRIHHEHCNHCNKGEGVRDRRLPNNYWHGPYESVPEAEAALQTCGAVIKCGTCKP